MKKFNINDVAHPHLSGEFQNIGYILNKVDKIENSNRVIWY